MKVVHNIPEGTFKYQCDECGKLFNWDENSIRYGKLEYKTISEQLEKEKIFCSEKCAKNQKA